MKRLLAVCALSASLYSCGDAPSESACQKLFEHLTDLEIEEGGVSEDKKASVKAKMIKSERVGFLKRCNEDLPGSQVRCGRAAKTLADVEKCDEDV